MISLDTNILIYTFDRDAGPKRDKAQHVVDAALDVGGVVALQVLGEFLATARKKSISESEANELTATLRRFFSIASLDESAFDRGVWAAREHKFPIWDAMLWATLDQAGCRTLLTEDFQDGRTLGGLTFLDPLKDENADTVAALLKNKT